MAFINAAIPQLVVLHLAQMLNHCFRRVLYVKLHLELVFPKGVLVNVQSTGVITHHWEIVIEALYLQ